MENGAIEKITKNKENAITLDPETVEKYKMKNYHDLCLTVNILLSADMFR